MKRSKYLGVYVRVRRCDGVERWRCQCGSGGKSMQYLGSYDTEEQAADARQKVTGDRPFSRWYMKTLALAGITLEPEVPEPPDPDIARMEAFLAGEREIKEQLLDGKYECFYCGKGYEEPPEICPKCLKSKYIEIIVV